MTTQTEVLDTNPPNDGEGNALQTLEGKSNLEKHSEKDQQVFVSGTKTVNPYRVDYKKNEKESNFDSLSFV